MAPPMAALKSACLRASQANYCWYSQVLLGRGFHNCVWCNTGTCCLPASSPSASPLCLPGPPHTHYTHMHPTHLTCCTPVSPCPTHTHTHTCGCPQESSERDVLRGLSDRVQQLLEAARQTDWTPSEPLQSNPSAWINGLLSSMQVCTCLFV